MNRVTKKESSIPVSARVSIVDLAKMDRYWGMVEGTQIKSMSQLVSWSVSALVEVIEKNGKMPNGMDRVADAHKYLMARGMYQDSLLKRGKSRINAAMQMEALREEGLDPSYHAPIQHRVIHSKHSAEAFDGEGVSAGSGTTGIDWEEAFKLVEEAKRKEREVADGKVLRDAINGGLVADEFIVKAEERDEEIVEMENAPIDESQLVLVDE